MPTFEYTGPVEITTLPITVKAIATKTGYQNSQVVANSYTQSKVETPTFNPVGGTYPYAVTVTIACGTAGAAIKYSIDGSTPTLDYTGPFTVNSNTPVKAVGIKTNWLNSDEGLVVYNQAQVPVVTFTPTSSAVVFPQTVYLATTLGGCTIYYTIGSNPPDPTTNDITYNPNTGIVVNSATTIKAIAVKTGYLNSNVSSASYTQVQVATPTISQAYNSGNNYWYPNTITLTDATSGAAIYYTVDDSTPTQSSTLYTAPFAITSSVTVKARAFKTGYLDSNIASRLYDQQRVTQTPTISQNNSESSVPNSAGALYPTVVTLAGESGSTFYYTVDGSTPDNTSTLYSAPFNNTGAATIKAIAYKTNYAPSAVATQAYTQRQVVAPTFSQPSGEIILGSTVSAATTTPACSIYYTVDGSTPDNTSTLYTGPITINSAVTIKAIAYKTGGFQPSSWQPSSVTTVSYTGPIAPAVIIDPNGSGEYEFPVRMLLTTANPVDAIYYTVDGSTPTSASTLYTGYFTVTTDGTVVKAFSVKSGYLDSAVVTATINKATTKFFTDFTPPSGSAITDGATLTEQRKWYNSSGVSVAVPIRGFYNSGGGSSYLKRIRSTKSGKYVVAGRFTGYGYSNAGFTGLVRNNFIRLNADLTPDIDFRTGTDFAVNSSNGLNECSDVVELSDGSYVVGGGFGSVGGYTKTYLVKFNADGTVNTGFTAQTNGYVQYLAVNKFDRILLVGAFTQITPTGGSAVSAPQGLAYLNSDGTLYAQPIAGTNAVIETSAGATQSATLYNQVHDICSVTDGGFVLAGAIRFNDYNVGGATDAWGLVKLDANGTFDTNFMGPFVAPLTMGARRIYCVKPLRNGGCVVGGNFTSADANGSGTARNCILKINANGTVDTGFTSPRFHNTTLTPTVDDSGYVTDVEECRDGDIFVHGAFNSVGTFVTSGAPYNRHRTITKLTTTGGYRSQTTGNGNGPVGGARPVFYGLHAGKMALSPADNPTILSEVTTSSEELYYPNNVYIAGIIKYNNDEVGGGADLWRGWSNADSTSGAVYQSVSKFTLNGSDPVIGSSDLPGSLTLNQTGGVFPTVKVRDMKPRYMLAATSASNFKLGELKTATYTWAQVPTPTASPAAGAIAFGSTVTLNCSLSGSSIYYTVDGSTPTTASTLYTGPITVNSAQTIKALAVKSTYKDSNVMSADYTQLTVATPTANPTGSAVVFGSTVALACSTSGAVIHYTTDGSAPTSGSATYSTPLTINAAQTIKALAVKSGCIDSAVMSESYTQAQVATPTANPVGSAIQFGSTVALSCATSGALISYTTDGSTPAAIEQSLIPQMTNFTVPSGTASASSASTNSPRYAYYAMDRGLYTWPWQAEGSLPQWLQYSFPTVTTVGSYAITVWSDTTHMPTNFRLQGSVLGSIWVDLNTQTGITWLVGERKIFNLS
ncbi:MAG: hypothetical protein EBU46_08570, partial [Nitrosomonadaceae bacterium]|nr:hypothetical protein [Nitrosomonadaceae bacterium]